MRTVIRDLLRTLAERSPLEEVRSLQEGKERGGLGCKTFLFVDARRSAEIRGLCFEAITSVRRESLGRGKTTVFWRVPVNPACSTEIYRRDRSDRGHRSFGDRLKRGWRPTNGVGFG